MSSLGIDMGFADANLKFCTESGKPKGFCYIKYDTVDSARKAVEGMDGALVAGRAIRTDFSSKISDGRYSKRRSVIFNNGGGVGIGKVTLNHSLGCVVGGNHTHILDIVFVLLLVIGRQIAPLLHSASFIIKENS